MKASSLRVLLVGGLGLGLFSASAHAGGLSTHTYYYYKTPMPLNLDPGKVAIYRNPSVDDSLIEGTLQKFSLQRANLDELVHNSWVVAERNAALDLAASEALTNELAADANLEFVSPVLRDEKGRALLITQEIFVGFDSSVLAEDAYATLASVGATEVVANYAGMTGIYKARLSSKNGAEVLDMANSLALLPQVTFAEPNKVVTYELHLIPNDFYFSNGGLWGLRNTGQSGGTSDQDLDAEQVWDVTTGSASVIIGVFDLGIQQNHPDMNQIAGADFTGDGGGGGPVLTCDNHGTQVAGCITAIINNNRGVVGIAPNCRSRSYRIGRTNGCTVNTFTGEDGWLATALNEARTQGHRITNSSFGRGPSSTVSSAYATTRNAGLIHFVSSGNDGESTIGYPSSLDTVYAVGALNRNGNRASFSNFGTGLDFSAPGQDIWTCDRTGSLGSSGGDYTLTNGTSFASPYAAGVAALILSIDNTLTVDEVAAIMAGSSVDRGTAGYDTTFGWGFLNANNALIRPQAFNLSTPAQGAIGVSQNPTLTWTGSTNAQKYEITIDDDPTFITPNYFIAVNAPSTSHTLPAGTLVQGRVYHWRVVATRYDTWRRDATPTSRSFTVRRDCNGNGIDDTIDITSGTSQDCNENGRPDECDLQPPFAATSIDYTPLVTGVAHAFTLTSPPDATGNVTLQFRAAGDLGASQEFVDVNINGTPIGVLFDDASTPECPNIVNDQLVISAATYNAAKAGGNAVINIVPNSQVSPTSCSIATFITVTVTYSGPVSVDLNGNQVPDECEGTADVLGDANCDGLVNFDDINCFVGAIISQSQWQSCIGVGAACSYLAVNDINRDTLVNFADIEGFVNCLVAGACP